MELNLLSRYRTQLMGIAIIWVMFYHSKSDLSFLPILDAIKSCGTAGVDIFMLVSGFGIYFSLRKNASLGTFYKKRVLRILPYYLPIVVIYSLYAYYLDIWTIDIVMKNILMLSYWIPGPFHEIFDWYVPSILVIYLLSPLFYKLFKKNKNIACISVILVFSILGFLVSRTEYSRLQLVILRVPLYVAGFWIADYTYNNKDARLNIWGIIIALFTYVLGFSIIAYVNLYKLDFYKTYMMYGIILTTIPLCLFCCYLFSLFPKFKFPFLTLCGTYSLTLYIFHERVMGVLIVNGVTDYMDIIALIITFILAISWPKLIDYILARFSSEPQNEDKLRQ